MGTRPLIALTCQRREPGNVFKLEPALAIISDYTDAVWRAGGLPIPVFPTGDPDNEAADLLDNVDAVIAIGGLDVDPSRFDEPPHETTMPAPAAQEEFELALILGAIARQTPLLAICRGLQLLNVALGGTLDQHITGKEGLQSHGIPNGGGGTSNEYFLTAGSLAERVMGPQPTGRCHHHQAIGVVSPQLVVTGRTADGGVEAIEMANPTGWVLGVQWHPEETAATDSASQALFDAVVEQARRQRRD